MKNIKRYYTIIAAVVFLLFSLSGFSQKKNEVIFEEIILNPGGLGPTINIDFNAGPGHNHPMMAVWIEDEKGNYIQTLFVNESVARGYFKHADKSSGKWQEGALIRPASLPVWAHKRGIKNDLGNYMPTRERPVPDAYTSATPSGDFLLISKTDDALPQRFRIMFEINQSWDWNEYWTNNKYPDDEEYKTSSQPSVVYAVDIDLDNAKENYQLTAIGHGHYSGKTGEINKNLESMTTALEIAGNISVQVR
jgi:hypothetical protein